MPADAAAAANETDNAVYMAVSLLLSGHPFRPCRRHEVRAHSVRQVTGVAGKPDATQTVPLA
ncbi:hypothetical protein MCNF_07250 [Mycolicibacterium confluentis]|uniref:Uncharacterized protein n=1 Tax=Mycolicibacterium confluentis TaxID=28047 RepID=A0A7I7XSB0_9MYCO|nr:hypothetical protein MCNF_07250 [Mycolicibacterium confluentis]